MSAAQLTLTALPGMPLVAEGDSLLALIDAGMQAAGLALQDGDVLVLAQKIVSKAEGRLVRLDDVVPGNEALLLASRAGKDPRLVQLILDESREVVRAVRGVIIVEHRLGFISANAGIDHSNVSETDDVVLLLPADPDASARHLRDAVQAKHGAAVGVIVNDSHGRPWRSGTQGVAIGVAGVPALVDMRGEPDLFGSELVVTTVGVADELAAAASLLMGQAAEGRPVVHVRGFPYPLRESSLPELLRPKAMDLFR